MQGLHVLGLRGPILLACVLGALIFPPIAGAFDPDLDPSFGVGGLAQPAVSGLDHGTTAQYSTGPNAGKLVTAVGTSDQHVVVARMLGDGSLDPSFGDAGTATISLAGLYPGEESPAPVIADAWAITPDTSGRILVGGILGPRVSSAAEPTYYFLIALRADGTLDDGTDSSPAFGTGGIVIGSFGCEWNSIDELAVYPQDSTYSGRIVAGGHCYNANTDSYEVVSRFLPDGSLDSSFAGGTGAKRVMVGEGPDDTDAEDFANAIALYKDGKILLAGRSAFLVAGVTRLLPDGSRDPSFGGDGGETVSFSPGGDGNGVIGAAVDEATGKITLGGWSGTHGGMAALRLLSDGSYDNTFSADGRVVTNVWTGEDVVESMAIDDQGRIDLAGHVDLLAPSGSPDPSRTVMVVLRYLPDGTLDSTFSGDGVAAASPPAGTWMDGRVVFPDANGVTVAGVTRDKSSNFWSYVLARFRESGPDNPADTSIAAGPANAAVLGPHAEPVFKSSADEPLATFQCSLDGSRFKSCPPREQLPRLSRGIHRFRVRSMDRAGHVDHTPAKRTFRIRRHHHRG